MFQKVAAKDSNRVVEALCSGVCADLTQLAGAKAPSGETFPVGSPDKYG